MCHYGYDCPPWVSLVYEQELCYNQNFGDNYFPQNSPSFPQQYICCENCRGPHENFQCQPRNQNYFESNPCYNPNSYGFDQPTQTSINHRLPKETSVRELLFQEKLHKALQAVYEKLNQQEQAANVSTHTPKPSRRFNIIYDYDDDDEESTIPLNKITSQIPPSIAITPVLPTMEPEDSLIIGDENLSTIPEKEPDEVIKSSVEDLFPIPSESEDTSDNDKECDLPFCDNSVTFSNSLFDANDDFTSSDDESLPEEDVQDDNFNIYSNPLFEFDEEYIFSDVNPLFNEVLEDIKNKDSYVSDLDEPALLVTPFSDANEDECFDPGGDIDEIDAFLDTDASTDIKEAYHDWEGDIIYLESLIINNTIPNLPPEGFLYHDPKSLKDEPDNVELKCMVKFLNRGFHEEIIFF
ncbi:hypothetical protein Tco_1372275 [Tanacetum coccineum]